MADNSMNVLVVDGYNTMRHTLRNLWEQPKFKNAVAAKEAGVNNHIVKPFNAATLKQKMETAIGPIA